MIKKFIPVGFIILVTALLDAVVLYFSSVYLDLSAFKISAAIALGTVLFWLLFLKPYTVFYQHFNDQSSHNIKRVQSDIVKAQIIFFLVYVISYLFITVTDPDIIIHYEIDDGVKFIFTAISLMVAIILAVVVTLFRHVKEDVQNLVHEAKAKTAIDLEESKKIAESVVKVTNNSKMISSQLAAQTELISKSLELTNNFIVTKEEGLAKNLGIYNDLIEVVKTPCENYKNLQMHLEKVNLYKEHVIPEINHNLPYTKDYLLHLSVVANIPSKILLLIKQLGLNEENEKYTD